MSATAEDSSAVARRFHVGFSKAEITDSRRQIDASRCPEPETRWGERLRSGHGRTVASAC
jgi:hypothetical protein